MINFQGYNHTMEVTDQVFSKNGNLRRCTETRVYDLSIEEFDRLNQDQANIKAAGEAYDPAPVIAAADANIAKLDAAK